MDVQSLYTYICHLEVLSDLRFFLVQRPNLFPSTNSLICLPELVLVLNSISSDSAHFLLVKDVGTDTHMGPSYASPIVVYIEQLFTLNTPSSNTPYHHYSTLSPVQ